MTNSNRNTLYTCKERNIYVFQELHTLFQTGNCNKLRITNLFSKRFIFYMHSAHQIVIKKMHSKKKWRKSRQFGKLWQFFGGDDIFITIYYILLCSSVRQFFYAQWNSFLILFWLPKAFHYIHYAPQLFQIPISKFCLFWFALFFSDILGWVARFFLSCHQNNISVGPIFVRIP